MSDWKEITTSVERGDFVTTPQGDGRVMRVSQAQRTAHVMTGDGNTLEVPLDQVKKGSSPTPQGEFKVGDKVKLKDTGAEGKVVNVSDKRGIEFKHKANGKRKWVSKDEVEPLTPQQPTPQPKEERRLFKKGDRVILKAGARYGYQRDDWGEGDFPEAIVIDDEPDNLSASDVSVNIKSVQRGYRNVYPHDDLELVEDKKEEKEEQAPEVQKEDKVAATGDGLLEIMRLQDYMEKQIDNKVDGELKELRDLAKANAKLEITIDGKTTRVEGKRHRQLETLITYTALRLPTLLVGMAGTGKTHAGEQASEALDIPFYSMSVGAQTSKTDIIGYMDANGKYVKTFFREAYENGGVFLMDEIDAGNANVLIQVNAALSNGLCAFPDAMVKKHKDFVFIASANTYGTGASRQYVGRNQLDAATLDRFAIIDWEIDDELEQSLAIGVYGQAWYQAVKAARGYVADHNIRAVVSPRATLKGSQLLAAGIHVDEVVKAVLLGSVPQDKKADVTKVAVDIFDTVSRDVPSKVKEAIGEELPF